MSAAMPCQRMRDEVWEAAKADAFQAMEDTLAACREALEAVAKHRRHVENDFEDRVEQGIASGVAERETELEERLRALRPQRDQARAAREEALRLLAAVCQQLLPKGRRVYLASIGITEPPLHQLNLGLKPRGLRIRSEATRSDLQVKVELGPGKWAQHSLFWREDTLPEAAEDPETEDKAPAGSPGPLALPEGQPPG